MNNEFFYMAKLLFANTSVLAGILSVFYLIDKSKDKKKTNKK